MAKYEDYVNKDELDEEIDTAAAGQEARKVEVELPAQFQGKTAEEIAASYIELQALNSRQANELGEARNTIDTLAHNRVHDNSQNDEEVEQTPVTVDDLYDDPEAAIKRVVDQRTNARVEVLEDQLKQSDLERRLSRFEQDHSDWRDIAASPEFQTWVGESPYRQRLAQASDQFDFDAAADLFGMYRDVRGVRTDTAAEETAKAVRAQQLADAALETGSTSVEHPVETFSRSEIQLKKQMKARGDRDSEVWLTQNADAIYSAYAEGRITD